MNLLGTIRGIVVRGLGIAGRNLGFPTANILPNMIVGIPDGVYAGCMTVDDKTYNAAICVGADGNKKIEAHLLDFAGDILGEVVELNVIERVSNLVPWESAEQMKKKITDDVAKVTQLLHRRTRSQARTRGRPSSQPAQWFL